MAYSALSNILNVRAHNRGISRLHHEVRVIFKGHMVISRIQTLVVVELRSLCSGHLSVVTTIHSI